MNKTEIINELLKNNPELVEDKKQVEKLVDLMMRNNPEIVADSGFKDSLKNKLNSIIELKKNRRKINYFQILSSFASGILATAFVFSFFTGSFFTSPESPSTFKEKGTTVSPAMLKSSPGIMRDSINESTSPQPSPQGEGEAIIEPFSVEDEESANYCYFDQNKLEELYEFMNSNGFGQSVISKISRYIKANCE